LTFIAFLGTAVAAELRPTHGSLDPLYKGQMVYQNPIAKIFAKRLNSKDANGAHFAAMLGPEL